MLKHSVRTRVLLVGLCLVATVAVIWLFTVPTTTPPNAEAAAGSLSWTSVGGECIGTVLVYYPVGTSVDTLLQVGASSTDSLIKALEDPSRAVAAHLVLSKLWLRNGGYTTQTRYIYADRKLLGWDVEINGLTWRWEERAGQSVSPIAQQACIARWHRILWWRRWFSRWLLIPCREQPVSAA
jgi:hypothetical protein